MEWAIFAAVLFSTQMQRTGGRLSACDNKLLYFMHMPQCAGPSALADLHSISPQLHPRPGSMHKGTHCLNYILKKGPTAKGAGGAVVAHPLTPLVLTLFRNPLEHVKATFLACAFSPWGRENRGADFPNTGDVSADFDTWLDFYIANGPHNNDKLKCYNPWNMQSEHLLCDTTYAGLARAHFELLCKTLFWRAPHFDWKGHPRNNCLEHTQFAYIATHLRAPHFVLFERAHPEVPVLCLAQL